MRVPAIGTFSPVDNVSSVRATSPSELVYQERTRPPATARVTARAGAPPPSASASNAVRAHLQDALHQLRQATDALVNGGPSPGAAPAEPSADNTISDTYPGVRGGTITVNGHSINVTPGVTTLREVVAALDTIPGLFAAVDSATGTIVVAGMMADKKLDITDSSGLLHALGLQTGVLAPTSAVPTSITDPGAGAGPPEHAGQIGRALDAVNSAAVDADRLTSAVRTDPNAVGHVLREQLAQPLQDALGQSDASGALAHVTSSVTNKGAVALPLPPVELFEAVLDDAARQDT